MHDSLTPRYLRILLRKRANKDIPLACDAALDNDYIGIYLEDLPEDPDRTFSIIAIKKNGLLAREAKQDGLEVLLPLDAVRRGHLRIMHFYKLWTLTYVSLSAAVLSVVFHLQAIRWLFRLLRDRRLSYVTNQYELLRTLLDMSGAFFDERIPFDSLMGRLYGPAVAESTRFQGLAGRVLFQLESLKDTGEISYNENPLREGVLVKPKALETIAHYELEASRHTDTLKVSRGQLLVAIALMLLALATLVARVWEILHDPA